MRLRNLLEEETLKQQEHELTMEKLRQNREKAMNTHKNRIEELNKALQEKESQEDTVKWLQEQLALHGGPSPAPLESEEARKKREAEEQKLKLIEDIRSQQQDLAKKLADLTGEQPSIEDTKTDQAAMIQQLHSALTTKAAGDPQKAMLRALMTQSNKTPTLGGAQALRPEIMAKLLNSDQIPSNDMSSRLANFNKEDEGESLLRYNNAELEGGCSHTKLKSGMLDKSTMNIKQKQVWPQKNLGEDWAEEEIDYKHIRFEQLVAGETRTIETCTEPAQILGRLRLLRRIAYLKLRGYEWYLLRRMYTAILTAIETGEYSWESNFDRFETILYRRTGMENRPARDRGTGIETGDQIGNGTVVTTTKKVVTSLPLTQPGSGLDHQQSKDRSSMPVQAVSSRIEA